MTAPEDAEAMVALARLTDEIEQLRTKVDGHLLLIEAAWKRALADFEADRVKIAETALRMAADVDWASGKDGADTAPGFLTDWQRGLVSGQTAMRDAILAITPAGVIAQAEKE